MRKPFYFLPFVFLWLIHHQTVAQQSLLWKIEGKGLSKPSYLYGTMHSKNKKIFEFNKTVLDKIDECESMAGELVLDDEAKMKAMSLFMIPGTATLKDFVTDKQYEQIGKLTQEKVGVPIGLLSKIQPIFVQVMIEESSAMDGEMPESLDEYFQKRAKDKGKKVFGLETMEEQAKALTGMPLKDQAKSLVKSVKNFDENQAESKKKFEQMTANYLKGDVNQLLAMSMDKETTPEMREALLDKRNVNMADRMAVAMQEKSLFAAIGAAHLAGDKGVIQLLKNKGYTVTPVVFTFDGTGYQQIKNESGGELEASISKSADSWFKVEDKEKGFTALFPEEPKKQSRQIENEETKEKVNATIYMIQNLGKGKVLLVAHTPNSKKELTKEERNKLIDSKLADATKQFRAKIISQSDISEQGAEGKLIVMEVMGLLTMELKVLIKGDHTYQVAYGFQKGSDVLVEKTKFFGNFKID